MKSLIISTILIFLNSAGAMINGTILESDQLSQIGTLEGNTHICTVTLVGTNSILTAAHCARAGVGLRAVIEGISYNVVFESHPDYDMTRRPNVPESFAVRSDIALGKLDRNVSGIDPVTISANRPAVKEILFIGGSGMPNMGVRQYGFMKVDRVGDFGVTLVGSGTTPQTGARGDSGGGTFRIDSRGYSSLVAVNSSSNWGRDNSKDFGPYFGQPYMQGSALPDLTFLREAAKKLRVSVCGVNATCLPVKFYDR